MEDESKNISAKTWARSVMPITKEGFKEGAASGQAAVFQQSFDIGYNQGFEFGFHFGYRSIRKVGKENFGMLLSENEKDNCQLCLNNVSLSESVCNISKKQMDMKIL